MVRRVSLWTLTTAIAALLLAALLEAAAVAWFAFQEGGLFYTAQREVPPPAPRDLSHSVFRPYLGFGVRTRVPVRRFLAGPDGARPYLAGGEDGAGEPAWLELRSNNFGFYSPVDYPLAEPDSFIVGVFGGSVAHSLAMQGGARLEERLEARFAGLPALAGRRVRVLNFASGGYKQPQQAIALAYFLFLGQRFDHVINLDGFNEAVLAVINTTRGLDTSMPSVVHLAGLELMAASDAGALRRRLALEDLRDQREALQRERAGTRFAARYLLAELRLRRATARWTEQADAAASHQRGRGMVGLLPPLLSPERTEKIAGEWERGSRLLDQLARSVGAGYLHVLQPNQYAGERSFSEEEARIALNPQSSYAPWARRLFPVLRERGAALAAAGVRFIDAGALFDAIPQIVYADDCCHYNQRGNNRLADFLAERVAEQVAKRGAPARP